MPWRLYYLRTPDEDQAFSREFDVLVSNPDVARVLERETVAPARVLEVWFHDELFRTEDPTLLNLHVQRRHASLYTPPPTGVDGVIDALFHEVSTPVVPSEAQREIVRRYLESPDARRALAQTMIAPLRRSRDYASLARRMLQVEPMPPGAIPYAPPVMDQGRTGDATAPPQTPYSAMGGYAVERGGYAVQQPADIGAAIQSGATAFIAEVQQPQGLARIDGLHGMHAGCIGHRISITTSPHLGNNGVWPIVSVVNAGSVWVQNPLAALDHIMGHTWSEFEDPPATPFPRRELVGFDLNADYRFTEVSFVDNPPDPTSPGGNVCWSTALATWKMFGADIKIPERQTGWKRLLDGDFLENEPDPQK